MFTKRGFKPNILLSFDRFPVEWSPFRPSLQCCNGYMYRDCDSHRTCHFLVLRKLDSFGVIPAANADKFRHAFTLQPARQSTQEPVNASMRARIRGPNGQATISLTETATVEDLRNQIAEKTSISSFDAKYGYPPKPLLLQDYQDTTKLSEIGVKLDGEQLIISKTIGSPAPENAKSDGENSKAPPSKVDTSSQTSRKSFTSPAPTQRSNKGPSATQSPPSSSLDAPELQMPDHASTMVLRIMPDDNSCLFRAFNTAFLGGMDNMHELRSIIAQNIQANPDIYDRPTLDEKPDDYCRWIMRDDAWGGAIEMTILSKHFDIEICSIDVKSLRVDRFNEGRPTRCIIVYSGIHYDTIALSPSDPPYTQAINSPDFDTKVFDAADSVVLNKAIELCRILQGKDYYTDTANFSIQCNVCGKTLVGEKGATEHAKRTGHYDFGEAR